MCVVPARGICVILCRYRARIASGHEEHLATMPTLLVPVAGRVDEVSLRGNQCLDVAFVRRDQIRPWARLTACPQGVRDAQVVPTTQPHPWRSRPQRTPFGGRSASDDGHVRRQDSPPGGYIGRRPGSGTAIDNGRWTAAAGLRVTPSPGKTVAIGCAPAAPPRVDPVSGSMAGGRRHEGDRHHGHRRATEQAEGDDGRAVGVPQRPTECGQLPIIVG